MISPRQVCGLVRCGPQVFQQLFFSDFLGEGVTKVHTGAFVTRKQFLRQYQFSLHGNFDADVESGTQQRRPVSWPVRPESASHIPCERRGYVLCLCEAQDLIWQMHCNPFQPETIRSTAHAENVGVFLGLELLTTLTR